MNKNMATRFLSTQLQLESVQPIMEHDHEPVVYDSNEMQVSFDGVSWETVPLTHADGLSRCDLHFWGRNTPSGKTRIDEQFKTVHNPQLESGLSARTVEIIDQHIRTNPLHPVDMDVSCMYMNPIRPLGSVGRSLVLNGVSEVVLDHSVTLTPKQINRWEKFTGKPAKNPRKAGAPKRRKKSKTFGKNK